MRHCTDESTREGELTEAEKQMGCSCSPLGRMISRAIKGRNGRGERSKERLDYAMAYDPPAQAYYVRPNARTITVTTNEQPLNAHAHAYAAVPSAPPQPGSGTGRPRKKKKKKRVTFTPEAAGTRTPANTPPPHAGHAPRHAATVGSVHHHHGGAAEPYSSPQPGLDGQGHACRYDGYGRRHNAPSPLPRWDAVATTPRRHEYFSGEYRWYYPTPVRETIYSFATDANHRLTAIFSEENPNACTIF